MSSTNTTTPRSVPAPNYTQAPNFFFDQIMPYVSSTAELKVTLAIIRQTFGYHKEEDKLSLSRLQELTGLSRMSVAEGIKLALKRGYVGRRMDGDSYIYGLRVGSKESIPPPEAASKESIPVASKESLPTKENNKRNVEANASSAKAQSVGLEKYIVDEIYRAMREAKFRLPNERFAYQLGRAQDMLAKDEPTETEIEELPGAFVEHWTIKGWADAAAALMHYRRQRKRPDLVRTDGPAPWEPKNPHSPRPAMDPEKLAKEKARREEVAKMLRSAS